MSTQKLAKAPLVEAILEIRWRLKPNADPQGPGTDPGSKILLGRIYDRLQNDYQEYEALPTASFPDELMNYIPQHRFRVAAEEWPLVQIGPGVITLNDTKSYSWPDFQRRAEQLVGFLFESYPQAHNSLSISTLSLRYIDQVPFDFVKEDILAFMAGNLRVKVTFPHEALASLGVSTRPIGLHSIASFPSTTPRGALQLQFSRGEKDGGDALVWETKVVSSDTDVPAMPDGFRDWLEQAHHVTHNLFFAMIEGQLFERFQ